MSTATAPAYETTVLHVGGLHYASEKARRRAGAGRPAGRARGRGQPRRADRHRHLRPGRRPPSLTCGVGRGVRLPLRRPVRARPRLRPAGRAGRDRCADARPRGHGARRRRARPRPRRPRRHVDGGDGARHAQPLPRRARVHDPDRGLVDGRHRAVRHRARRRRSGSTRDLWQFLLSLPVVLYASSIFFTGAVAALRGRTLDMMVLVAVAIGVGWIYSVAATFFIEGEVFYEAAGDARHASCCSATGSRCAPAAAPTTPSARCSTSRRRRRS